MFLEWRASGEDDELTRPYFAGVYLRAYQSVACLVILMYICWWV